MFSFTESILYKNKFKALIFILFITFFFIIFFPSFYNASSRARISSIKSAYLKIEGGLFIPTINTIYKYKDNPDWNIIYKELTKFVNKVNGFNEKGKVILYLDLERYKNSRFTSEIDKINEILIPLKVYKKLEIKELYFGSIVYDIKYLGIENGEKKYHYWLYYIDKDGEFLKDEKNQVVSRDEDIYEIK